VSWKGTFKPDWLQDFAVSEIGREETAGSVGRGRSHALAEQFGFVTVVPHQLSFENMPIMNGGGENRSVFEVDTNLGAIGTILV
jgi:hypothetical protein